MGRKRAVDEVFESGCTRGSPYCVVAALVVVVVGRCHRTAAAENWIEALDFSIFAVDVNNIRDLVGLWASFGSAISCSGHF